ncbi:MAG: long-chain fatty acid--CoA ligase [Acidobacteria bacterium]|nr:long-chain fatty acid--CoA ligase [Acidobacteriota bacterium]
MIAGAWLSQLAARAAGGLAVVDQSGEWTSRELLDRAGGASAWLDAIGAPVGRPVPAVLRASPAALALVVAGAWSNRPIAPLGPLLSERELTACLGSTRGAVLVFESSTAAMAAKVASTSGIPSVAMAELDRAPLGPPQPGDTAVELHTSGTGGTPKRVDVRHAPLAARTAVLASLLDLGPGDRYVTAKGIHHIGGLGLTLAALAAGAAVIPMPRYSREAWAALTPLEPTHGSVVPTMVEDMLSSRSLRLPTMRVLQYGGAPIHPDTLVALLAAEPDLDVVSLYGQTEGSPIASLSAVDHRHAVTDAPHLLTAAGRPAPGIELRVDEGEVLARGAHLFRPGADGWLRTGDLGAIDGDGYLFLTGRAGDVIVRGGENVHPLEVEQVLATHPAVADVAVAGVDDRRLGQTVGAWVVPAGDAPDVEALRVWARHHLAGFKVPTVWTFCESIPRNANGKIVRRGLTP